MSSRRTPAFAATLYFAKGQPSIVEFPRKWVGKPSPESAATFLKDMRSMEVTADAVKVEVFDNKGNRGVLASA